MSEGEWHIAITCSANGDALISKHLTVAGPSSSSHQNGVAPVTDLSQEDQQVFLDQSSTDDDDDGVEDDDLNDEELDALEGSIEHKA